MLFNNSCPLAKLPLEVLGMILSYDIGAESALNFIAAVSNNATNPAPNRTLPHAEEAQHQLERRYPLNQENEPIYRVAKLKTLLCRRDLTIALPIEEFRAHKLTCTNNLETITIDVTAIFAKVTGPLFYDCPRFGRLLTTEGQVARYEMCLMPDRLFWMFKASIVGIHTFTMRGPISFDFDTDDKAKRAITIQEEARAAVEDWTRGGRAKINPDSDTLPNEFSVLADRSSKFYLQFDKLDYYIRYFSAYFGSPTAKVNIAQNRIDWTWTVGENGREFSLEKVKDIREFSREEIVTSF